MLLVSSDVITTVILQVYHGGSEVGKITCNVLNNHQVAQVSITYRALAEEVHIVVVFTLFNYKTRWKSGNTCYIDKIAVICFP